MWKHPSSDGWTFSSGMANVHGPDLTIQSPAASRETFAGSTKWWSALPQHESLTSLGTGRPPHSKSCAAAGVAASAARKIKCFNILGMLKLPRLEERTSDKFRVGGRDGLAEFVAGHPVDPHCFFAVLYSEVGKPRFLICAARCAVRDEIMPGRRYCPAPVADMAAVNADRLPAPVLTFGS